MKWAVAGLSSPTQLKKPIGWFSRLVPSFGAAASFFPNITSKNGALAMEEQKQKEKDKEPIKEASEEISRHFKTLLDCRDLDSLKQTQHLILGRLQDSNAVLSHFNEYSENCYAEVSVDLAKNTRVLKSMKADLDYIFQKLRSMKSRMLANYPDAFPGDSKGEVLDRRPDLELP